MLEGISKDENGKTSATSVMKLSITAIIMIVWAITSLTSGTIAALPMELVWLICGAMGIGVANKGVSIFKPKQNNGDV